MGTIIDGKAVAAVYAEGLKARVAAHVEKTGVQPGLAVVICGEDPSSKVYVNNILKRCAELGIAAARHEVPEEAGTDALCACIEALNEDASVHGIICQFPTPRSIDERRVRETISPEKDVDAAGTVSIGRLFAGQKGFVACTPLGMMMLLKSTGEALVGKHAVIVGRSNVVGKPLTQLLLNEHMTVSVCHSRTADLGAITRQADVLMTAVGVAHLIQPEHIKPGAVVIDAGINVTENGIVGDVDWKACQEVAGRITPVPGGVGPTTNLMLIENTLEACVRLCESGR